MLSRYRMNKLLQIFFLKTVKKSSSSKFLETYYSTFVDKIKIFEFRVDFVSFKCTLSRTFSLKQSLPKQLKNNRVGISVARMCPGFTRLPHIREITNYIQNISFRGFNRFTPKINLVIKSTGIEILHLPFLIYIS